MPDAKPEAKVLVVDDEAQIRRLVSVLLRRIQSDYTVSVMEAGTAEDAMQALQGYAYDLVITDHSMPGKTGIDLLEVAHSRYPQTARMLITALAQLDIGVDAINRGHVDAFLRKPWDNDSFVALVHSLLEPRVRTRAILGLQPKPVTTAPGQAPSTARATSRIAPPAGATSPRAQLEAELAEVDRQMRQIRVRLGLGSLSAEGYAALNSEFSKKRADLEVQLLDLTM